MKLMPPVDVTFADVATANATYKITSKTKLIEVVAADVEDLKRIGWREPVDTTTSVDAAPNATDTSAPNSEG